MPTVAPVPAYVRRPYTAVTVTLTLANTNYQLSALVDAILAAQTPPGASSQACREFNIQANPGIDGVGGNTNDILVGDALLSATNYGYVLSANGNRIYRSNQNHVQVSSIFVQSAGAGQKLNVEIMTA